MKTIVAKLDDDTFRQLEELTADQSRSELVRTAIREFVAKQRIERRRREVEEYMRTSGESGTMRDLAEADMDHAAELLARAEGER